MMSTASPQTASYAPIDIGFDLRALQMAIRLPDGEARDLYAITYTTRQDETRTVTGDRRRVMTVLRRHGYRVR